MPTFRIRLLLDERTECIGICVELLDDSGIVAECTVLPDANDGLGPMAAASRALLEIRQRWGAQHALF